MILLWHNSHYTSYAKNLLWQAKNSFLCKKILTTSPMCFSASQQDGNDGCFLNLWSHDKTCARLPRYKGWVNLPTGSSYLTLPYRMYIHWGYVPLAILQSDIIRIRIDFWYKAIPKSTTFLGWLKVKHVFSLFASVYCVPNIFTGVLIHGDTIVNTTGN